MDWSRALIRAAHDRGLTVVVADTAENLESVESSPRTTIVEVDWRSGTEVTALALALAEGDLGAVVAFREFSLHATAQAAAACGLPWNSVASIELTRDKLACREAVQRLGYRQPTSVACSDVVQALAALGSTGLPAVVKPRSAYGSQGVALVTEPAQVAGAFASAARFAPSVLVEEFVEGAEFSAEGGFVDGRPVLLAVTCKRVAGETSFVETGHRTADDLADDVVDEVRRTLEDVLPGLGLTHSLFHVEFWLTARGLVLGEVHSRTGGDWIHRLAQESSGIDPFALVLDNLMGTATVGQDVLGSTGSAAAVSAIPSSYGVVDALLGLADVCADPRLLVLDLSVVRGSVLTAPTESGHRAGLVVARSARGTAAGERGVDAARTADRLACEIDLVTDVGGSDTARARDVAASLAP